MLSRRTLVVFIPAFLSSVFLAACATTDVRPIDADDAEFSPHQDEERLWATANRLERHLELEQPFYEDPRLDSYLAEVTEKLIPEPMQKAELKPRIKVLRSPSVNAFILPNGAMYITAGLLARIKNEAQLATILSHELGHYMNRHALKESRNTQNKEKAASLMGLLLGGGLGHEATQVWTMASTSGYSRELRWSGRIGMSTKQLGTERRNLPRGRKDSGRP